MLPKNFVIIHAVRMQVHIIKHFSAIFYNDDVKYVTFKEPVLERLSPDFVYVYIERIETN